MADLTPIKLVTTDVGRAELINADQTGTGPTEVTQIGFGTGQYVANSGMTALQSEFKRVSSIAGGAISPEAIHVTARDQSQDAYDVFEVGLYLASGTLLAVYSSTDPIIEKAAASGALISFDIVLEDGLTPAMVTFGDTNFSLNTATSTTEGLVRLATVPEALTGTDDTTATTPEGVRAVVDAIPPVPIATTTTAGRVRRATTGETSSGAAVNAYVTPEGAEDLAGALISAALDEAADNQAEGHIDIGGVRIMWGRGETPFNGPWVMEFPGLSALHVFQVTAGDLQDNPGFPGVSYPLSGRLRVNVSMSNADGRLRNYKFTWLAIGSIAP